MSIELYPFDTVSRKFIYMVWTSEISSDDGNEPIIKSYMEGNKCGNVL